MGSDQCPSGVCLGWLKASGAEGVTVRPFFTANTGQACRKERFALRWLKRAEIGRQKIKEMWAAVRGIRGVYGLVTGGVDVAIRMDMSEVDMAGLLEALKQKGVELKDRKEGLQWWCVENLEERDLWRIPDIIASLG